jgi:hypothetical protein
MCSRYETEMGNVKALKLKLMIEMTNRLRQVKVN